MDYREYRKQYNLDTLREIRSNLTQLVNLTARSTKFKDEHGKHSKDLEEVEKAIEYYNKLDSDEIRDARVDFVLKNKPLTPEEEEMIKALRETVLGREGNISDAFLNSVGQKAINSLIKKGIVQELEHHTHYSYLPNHTHYGLVGELYPSTTEEFHSYRDTGWSEKASYKEYLDAMKKGEIEWTADKIAKFLDKDVSKFFKSKFKTKDFWINFTRPFTESLRVAKEETRNNKSAEEVLRITLVKYMDLDAFDRLKDSDILDMDWYKSVVSDRIKHLEKVRDGKCES